MSIRAGVAVTALLSLVAACGGSTTAPVVTQGPPETYAPIITDDPMLGSGVITFGTDYDPDTLRITNPKHTFKVGSKGIAWSASLSDTVGGTSVTQIIASRSKSGVERTLINIDIDISNPDSDTLANEIDLALLVDRKPGTYVMRYLRDGDVLAAGEFTLVR